ncbi:hypothetical protein [Natranaerobius thermophilus]|uniref:Uncharacterized protein n=1 Tax=Natranaerobius thermophilus (strain ATCC BAA-1301 / DSM 18059 / JW/NM-WN-LF) TaxID=457570 RepID=B2A7N7_NATTJ|nr:hypothetical protein [Natranaerobius thermophilus]ACB84339.1 hypothetical protein Nther_0749 [Natranaerobius thermophilus JW/NM-WN-LF]
MNRTVIGIMLVVLGILFLLGNLGILSGALVLLLVGGGFLFFYYHSGKKASHRNIGLLIPGAILIMVGIYDFLIETLRMQYVEGYLFFIFLSVAFAGIYLIHTRNLKELSRGKRIWPLYPALGLFMFGILIVSERQLESEIVSVIFSNLFPIALIITGIIIVIRAVNK